MVLHVSVNLLFGVSRPHTCPIQTDTNRQETLTNGTIGKKSSFVKEALRFTPLEKEAADRYSICKLHILTPEGRA